MNKNQRRNKVLTFLAFTAAALGSASAQTATPVIDLADVGETLVGYIPGAVAAGLAVFGAIIGIKIAVKAFKVVMQ